MSILQARQREEFQQLALQRGGPGVEHTEGWAGDSAAGSSGWQCQEFSILQAQQEQVSCQPSTNKLV
eukprot:scaffold239112_cov22-Tisochrysis_lutea.AAC.1